MSGIFNYPERHCLHKVEQTQHRLAVYAAPKQMSSNLIPSTTHND